jgi:hypothetical protein
MLWLHFNLFYLSYQLILIFRLCNTQIRTFQALKFIFSATFSPTTITLEKNPYFYFLNVKATLWNP